MIHNPFNIPFSILDLAPVVEGGTVTQTFQNTVDLAQHAERLGYLRYWLAEHHNMPGIASSATAIVMAHVAQGTSTIRVGSGGIMLPNHSPLVIAEQFGTLEALFPGRIDLGLGRAPGTDPLTAYALRRERRSDGNDFPELLAELRSFLQPEGTIAKKVRAIPGEGANIPIWLLGSSGFSAQLAGKLGLPFAFASHFSPHYTKPALDLYRSSFQPSEVLNQPYAMVAANVIAADSQADAEFLATSTLQQFVSLIRGNQGRLQPPVSSMDEIWTPYEQATLLQQFGAPVVGDQETVSRKLQQFLSLTEANEIIFNTQIYDHAARKRSFEIVAKLFC